MGWGKLVYTVILGLVVQGTKCRVIKQQSLEKHDISSAQVTGVHIIDKFMVFGKLWGGLQWLIGLLGSYGVPQGQVAVVVIRAGGMHTLGSGISSRCQCSNRGWLQTHI